MKTNADLFTFKKVDKGFVDIRDFQTAGVVTFAKGLPFSHVRAGKQSVNGHRVQVKQDYLENCVDSLEDLAKAL